MSLAAAETLELTDATTPLAAAWTGLGLTTSDGTTLARKVEKEGTEYWKQLTPADYIYKSLELTVASVFPEAKGDVRAPCVDWTDVVTDTRDLLPPPVPATRRGLRNPGRPVLPDPGNTLGPHLLRARPAQGKDVHRGVADQRPGRPLRHPGHRLGRAGCHR